MVPEQLEDLTPLEINKLFQGYLIRKEVIYQDFMTQAWYTAVFNAQTKTGKLEDLHKIINKIDFTGKNKNKTVNNLDQFKLLAHKYGLNTPWNNYSKGG